MTESREGLPKPKTLREYLTSEFFANEDEYTEEEIRLSKMAEKFGITPLQMGQIDCSLGAIEYQYKATDRERKPYIELIENVANEVGERKVIDIIEDFLLGGKRDESPYKSLVPDLSKTTLGEALVQFREITKIQHSLAVDAAGKLLSGSFHEVQENNPLKRDKTSN